MERAFLHKRKNQTCTLLSILLLASVVMVGVATASPGLSVTVSTDKQFYYPRQKVTIYGNLMLNASPVPDGLVALQINDPNGGLFVFRTLPTGTTPKDSKVKIVDVIPCDGVYWNPKNNFKTSEWLYVNVTVRNDDAYWHTVLVTVSVYDGNQNPIGLATPSSTQIGARSSQSFYKNVWIPAWAYIGNATVFANVYTDFPQWSGSPYSREGSATFQIINVETSYNSAGLETLQTNGSYSTTFTLPPDPLIGTYMVYVSSRYPPPLGYQALNSTHFEVESASYPPEASFFYTPPEPFVNMTVDFDASASTPNGGYIVNYTWNFGDGSSPVTENDSFTTHKYTKSGTYNVSLTVKDSEGLWGTDTKPIKIKPPEGPIARFSWTQASGTVTFDASSSRPGWNGTGWAYIINYTWNFGDGKNGTGKIVVHLYTENQTYIVTLIVTDTQNLSDSTWHTVNVTITTLKWDLDGDGDVDIFDVGIVAKAYEAQRINDPGDPRYGQYWHTPPCPICPHDPKTDIDGDGDVDIFDVAEVAKHYEG